MRASSSSANTSAGVSMMPCGRGTLM
jgi:hypothetical protein